MAHNTAWAADHAEDFAREEERRYRAARTAEIAELREGWTAHVAQFAVAAKTAAVEAGFAALAALAVSPESAEDFENQFIALDELIADIDRAADDERLALFSVPGAIANPVFLALDGWLNAQRATAAAMKDAA